MAEAKALVKDKTKNNKKKKPSSAAAPAASISSSSVPKYSKAARRFYNENIREPQRISKVLAAAGVASRRGSEELIFEGKVTVNGSMCTSPQIKSNRGIPKPQLFTAGRLDVATSGLIIVTNDGDFAQRVAHPSSELGKEYIATIEGSVHRRHLIAISEGTQIEGVHCVPDSVELLPVQPDSPRPRLRVVVFLPLIIRDNAFLSILVF